MTIRVAQITDIHLLGESGDKLYGVDTALSLTNTVNVIKKLPKSPDVIVATSDIAEDGAFSTYKRFKELLIDLNISVYVLPGNHDDVSEMESAFNGDRFCYTDKAELQNWGLLFVNSQVEGHSYGYVNANEIVKLEENIRDMEGRPILVALHHTPSTVCPSFGCQLKNSQQFTELLNRYPNVKGVIAGHTHTASELDAGRHIQFTTPSTFAHATHSQLGESVDHEDFWASHSLDGTLQGFRILDLSAEGDIKSNVCWIENME